MQKKNAMIDEVQKVFAASEISKKPDQLVITSTPSDPPASHTIAERLRTARLAAHLTQQELAGGLFSKSYISAVERGKMIPSLQALNTLAQRLAVPISYLIGEQDIDLVTLEESSAALRSVDQPPSTLPDENLAHLLEQAEVFLREDRPQEAMSALGEGETPPVGLTLLQRMVWYRLAGWAFGLLRKHDEAIRLLEHGLALAEQIHLRVPQAEQTQLVEMVAYLHCFLGNTYCALDKSDQARDYYQRALEAIRKDQVTDQELKALIYRGLGRVALAFGNYQEATTYYEEAVRHARHLKNSRLLGIIFWGLGVAYQERGDPFRAKVNYHHALRELERHANPHLLLQIRVNLGQALLDLDEYKEAEPYLLEAMREAQSLGDRHMYGIAVVNMASLHRARGELTQALALANTALQWVQQHPDKRTEGQLHLTLALIYEAKQESAAREQALREAIHLLEQAKEFSLLGQAYESYAQFLSEQGRFREAYEQMELAHRPKV
jgi:tetratricopeptide (TPR) repeat protein